MESKAHHRRDYSQVSRMTRTERDLSSRSQGSDSSFDNSTLSMLKRAVPRGRRNTNTANPHVCVIGAGVAGLRCTEMLVNRGIRVTIFEGRNRLGGRVGSSKREMERYSKEYRSTKPNCLATS